MWEAVWGGCQPQPWCNDIIMTAHKWPRAPKSEPSRVDTNCVRLLCYTSGQHSNVLKHFVYLCWKQFEVAVSLNHDAMPSFQLYKWPRTPKSEPSRVGNCVRLLPYAYGQHINVFKHFVYIQYRCRKQFEVAVSLNHDVMTLFQLHKWPRTPKSEPRG